MTQMLIIYSKALETLGDHSHMCMYMGLKIHHQLRAYS